jgi:hypothetical protein
VTLKTNAGYFVVLLWSASAVVVGQPTQTTGWTFPQARVVVRVLGEDGTPIPDVKTRLVFCGPTNVNDIVRVEGRTGTNGTFSGQGFSNAMLGGSLRKEGYYFGAANIPHFLDATNDQWQPWGATYTSVLRKIGNPVAVYAKQPWITIPAIGKPCGYDLEVGDWVSPHGGGKVSDFIFTLQRAYTNRDQFEVSVDLSFSNPSDGIQETELPKQFAQSWFIWPRQAPESGYKSAWRIEWGWPGKMPPIEDIEKQKYFFRVRTKEKDGKIVSALYGKLSAGFELAPYETSTCQLHMSYYLNPTPLDRNMEFDLEKNLLKGLNDLETPRVP